MYWYHFLNLTDGYDQVDHSIDGNALKNQMVGLLQAVSYLKGKTTTILNEQLFLLISLIILVPLIGVDILVILIEILAG